MLSNPVVPESTVQTTLIGFYSDEDIANEKELLFSFAKKCSPTTCSGEVKKDQ